MERLVKVIAELVVGRSPAERAERQQGEGVPPRTPPSTGPSPGLTARPSRKREGEHLLVIH